MKYLPLVWSGIWRKPGRTILILLQVAVAFALFGILEGMTTGVAQAITKVRADLLLVLPAAVGGTPLPLADLQQLQSIPGVSQVSYADSLVGTYQKPTQIVGVLAIQTSDLWLTLVPRIFQISREGLDTLRRVRTGALISADIGKKYGWHIGERVALKTTTLQRNGSGTWYFDIVGMVTDHEPGEGGLMVTSYDYLDGARALNQGTVRNFYVVVSDPKQAGAMAETIDRTFANSPSGTRTNSLRENAEQAVQSIGDLSFAIRSIVTAVLVAIVFSTATMMMQSIRERQPELAVLKTLGFGNRSVFALVAIESLLVCTAAALAGLALACTVFPLAGKYIPGLSMPLHVVGLGIVGAVIVALLSVSLPGLRAARLNVVDALAGR